MGNYWDTYGAAGAWCDRFGNHVDPRTFRDEDELHAAGCHYVDQGRDPLGWIARELGDVESVAYRRAEPTWDEQRELANAKSYDANAYRIPVESLGRE